MPFYKAFNIPLLSEFAIPSYEDAGNIQPTFTDSKNKYITKQSVLMIATWLREKRKNDYDRLLDDGTFDKLVSIQEATTDSNIMVSYRLVVNDIQESQEAEFPVYWDTNQEKNILIYNPKNSKKIEIDISNVMAKELFNYKNYKDCADWIELTLKAKNTERLKSKGWSVPREIENKYRDKKKAHDKPHNQEQNQFNVPDESNANVIDNENHQDDRPININQPTQPSNSKPSLPNNNPAVQKISNGSPLTPTTTIEPNEIDKPLTQNKSSEILVIDKIESKKINKIDGSEPDASDSTHSTDNIESQKTNKIDCPMPDDSNSKDSTVKPTDKSERKTDFKTSFSDSFNRPGFTEFDDEDDAYYSNSRVKNPERRGAKLREKHKQNIKNEPKSEERRRKVERELLEKSDPKVREALYQWYHGKCQICGNRWPKRNGEYYFVATYIMERHNAASVDNPGNAICLCAKHFAQWRLAAKENPFDIEKQIKELRLPSEGGKNELSIRFTLLGKNCDIKYCETHLLDLKEFINASD